MGFISNLVSGNAKELISGVNDLSEGKGTTRLRADDMSESWLTQSIRPLITLWVLTLVTVIIFSPAIVPAEMAAMIFAMLSDIIKFYFIARTSEKIIKVVTQSFLRK